MPTRQGDRALLDHPVAQRLLQSSAPARLAYTWTDGTPRVVPIGFHWNGTEIVLGTPPDAPKAKALGDGVGRAWLANLRPICPRRMRVFITPEGVAILDFQQRFPSALERAMERAASSG